MPRFQQLASGRWVAMHTTSRRRISGQPAHGYATKEQAAAFVERRRRRQGERPRQFVTEVIRPKRDFDKRSFRMVVQGSHRVRVGCPKGHWQPGRKRCAGATAVQAILHPVGEHHSPCPTCFHIRMYGA